MENTTKEVAGIKINDVVLYRNTASKISQCKVESFELVKYDKYWFRGIDVKTNAKVFYSVSITVDLMSGANWMEQQKLSQFEQMKTALVDVANMPDPVSYKLAFENAKRRCRTLLASLTETIYELKMCENCFSMTNHTNGVFGKHKQIFN